MGSIGVWACNPILLSMHHINQGKKKKFRLKKRKKRLSAKDFICINNKNKAQKKSTH
jgi:hypothetical protein